MIEIADKFNMVDMGGIDIVKSQGVAVDGLFTRLLNSIQQCRYSLLYNWYFAEISIVPTPVELVFDGEKVVINELISITSDDIVHVSSIEIPVYPPLQPLTIYENGMYAPPEGVYGFDEVTASVSTEYPDSILNWFRETTPFYMNGFEYQHYIYGRSIVESIPLVLLVDASQGMDGFTLEKPLSAYEAIVLQGIYNRQRTSVYNTTLMYLQPDVGTYWAGMQDRNSNYTCNVQFVSETEAVLTGNKQVLIYGIERSN